MLSAHWRRGAVLLSLLAGALLALGAWTATAQAEEHRQEGTWSPGGRLQVDRRSSQTPVKLADGRVLLVGGGDAPASAEIWDPDTRESQLVAPLEHDRYNSAATRLADGRVLVVGTPFPDDAGDTAEVYDPDADEWTSVGPMGSNRSEGHTVTLMGDGRVLVAGGDDGEGPTASAEVYDPGTGEWASVPEMAHPRMGHTATRLSDGRVLITGGESGDTDAPPASAQIFDPEDDQWTTVASMGYGRKGHKALRLGDGRVLVIGGQGAPAPSDPEAGSDDLIVERVTSLYVRGWVARVDSQIFEFTIEGQELGSGEEVTVNLDDAQRNEAVQYLPEDHDEFVNYDSPDGEVTASIGEDTAELTFVPQETITAGTTVTIEAEWAAETEDKTARPEAVFTRTDTGGTEAREFLVGPGPLRSVEIFDPATDGGQWQERAPLDDQLAGIRTVESVGDGTLLAVTRREARRYDVDDEWWSASGPESFVRSGETNLTRLDNGHVLVTSAVPTDKAEVYSPETVPPPVVESVSPQRGSSEGGFEVTIQGQDLADAVFVSFGDGDYRVGEVIQDSSEQIRVDAPAHPAEWASVRVVTPGGFSETDATTRVEFVAADGSWAATGDMAQERHTAAAVILDGPTCDDAEPPDHCGQALVVNVDSSELYDPDEGRFHSPAPLPDAMSGTKFTMLERRTTLLDGPACRGESPPGHCGKVLALDDDAPQAALYDPQSNTWQACGDAAGFDCPPLLDEHDNDQWSKTELIDGPECHDPAGEAPDHCGTVLAGAELAFGSGTPPEVWLFDPGSGTWTKGAQASEPRAKYAMTLIEGELCDGDNPPDACGDVLLTSGVENTAGEGIRTETAELYDPADNQWRDTAEGPPTPGRDWSTTTTLPDGRVLVAGGKLEFQPPSAQVDLFNPVDESWDPVPAMPDGRQRHSSVTLPDGRAMVAGGEATTPAGSEEVTSSVLVYDPDAGEWAYTDSMIDARAAGSGDVNNSGFPLVTLPDGRVLAAGGDASKRTEEVHTSAELYSLSPGSVAGLVLDDGTGDPIEGVEVSVTDASGAVVGSATTSADGTYQVSGVPFGTYTVTADAAGYEAASQDGVTVEPGEATRLDFALAQAPDGGGGPVPEPEDGLVAGTVTDAESGQTLGGVEVTVEGPTTASTTTDADGAYQLAGLAAGSYTVSADTNGYEAASQAVEVVEGEAATADFALQPEAAAAGATGSVAGTVTDAGSGEPVAGAEVTVTDAGGSEVVTAGTDTSGAYTAEGLAPGEYTLTVEATGYEAASQSVTVAGGEAAAADFALQPEAVEEPAGELGGELTSAQLVESACDPAAVPDTGFGDVAGSVHEDSVDCVAWYGLTLGLGDLDGDGQIDYGPNRPVTRDQMASFIARLAREAGVDLPDDPADAFGDDDGSVHEEAINQLAALGLVRGVEEGRYVPRAPVTRDQMASFLARLANEAGLGLPQDPPDAFGDDDGSVHEDNINALAAANITRGVSEGVYAPRNPVSRGQMASFLGRLLGGFVETGIAPEGGAEVTLNSTSTAPGGQLAGEVFAHKDVVSLTADGCGLSERELSVDAEGSFAVPVPADQAAGDCELALAVSTTRGGDAPVQTARYGFAVTVEAGGA